MVEFAPQSIRIYFVTTIFVTCDTEHCSMFQSGDKQISLDEFRTMANMKTK